MLTCYSDSLKVQLLSFFARVLVIDWIFYDIITVSVSSVISAVIE